VHHADGLLLVTEIRDLDAAPSVALRSRTKPLPDKIQPLTPDYAEQAFSPALFPTDERHEAPHVDDD